MGEVRSHGEKGQGIEGEKILFTCHNPLLTWRQSRLSSDWRSRYCRPVCGSLQTEGTVIHTVLEYVRREEDEKIEYERLALPLMVIPRLRLEVFTILTSNVPDVGTTASADCQECIVSKIKLIRCGHMTIT